MFCYDRAVTTCHRGSRERGITDFSNGFVYPQWLQTQALHCITIPHVRPEVLNTALATQFPASRIATRWPLRSSKFSCRIRLHSMTLTLIFNPVHASPCRCQWPKFGLSNAADFSITGEIQETSHQANNSVLRAHLPPLLISIENSCVSSLVILKVIDSNLQRFDRELFYNVFLDDFINSFLSIYAISGSFSLTFSCAAADPFCANWIPRNTFKTKVSSNCEYSLVRARYLSWSDVPKVWLNRAWNLFQALQQSLF